MHRHNHNICDRCFDKMNKNKDSYRDAHPDQEVCCYCGSYTKSGLSVIDDKQNVKWCPDNIPMMREKIAQLQTELSASNRERNENAFPELSMTYENARKLVSIEKQKETNNVSDRQLETDIQNTVKEIEAYQNLSIGYKNLAELPENEPVKSVEYRRRRIVYDGFEDECRAGLKFLVALKEVRQHDKDQQRKHEGSTLSGA